MVDEAAAALVPGPVATTALATLVIGGTHGELLESLASGERTAGVALAADLRFDGGRASGTAEYVLGADRGRGAAAARRRHLACCRRRRRRRDGRTAARPPTSPARWRASCSTPHPPKRCPLRCQRVKDLAATVLAAEAAGLARWTAADRDRVREGARAVRQADRQLPGHQAHVRRDAAARRADLGGRGRCRRGCLTSRDERPAVHRRRGGRVHRHRGRQGQRQGLHPGARRHRHHVGTRRPSVSAPRVRNRAVPRRRPGGCAVSRR